VRGIQLVIVVLVCSLLPIKSFSFDPNHAPFRRLKHDGDVQVVLQDLADGKYDGRKGHLFRKIPQSKIRDIFWRLSHIDDVVFGFTVGIGSWLFGVHRYGFREMRKVADGKPPKGIKVFRGDVAKKYVVFSDHHLLGFAKKHDYFKTWEQGAARSDKIEALNLYIKALGDYNSKGYTLVEAGDVEDMVTLEPTTRGLFIDSLFDFLIPFFGEIFDQKYEDKKRKLQLLDIYYNYRDLYKMISRTFVKDGRFIKLIGNHDIAFKKKYFLSMLRIMYGSPKMQAYDYLVLEPYKNGKASGYPQFIAAHGHQIDPWTNPKVAKLVGESFTHSEAWFGNGADRIWPKYLGGDGGWLRKMHPSTGFSNLLAKSPSIKREKGMTTKIRHMGERTLEKRMRKAFKNAPNIPNLILGHTHEPKIGALDKKGRAYNKYFNTGATGHYEQLIWCVEVVNGVGSLYAWYVDGSNKIIKQKMVPTKDGRLIPSSMPH